MATPPAMVRPRSVVPVGIIVVMPIARSRATGPARSARMAAAAGAGVAGMFRAAAAMNGPLAGCEPPIGRKK